MHSGVVEIASKLLNLNYLWLGSHLSQRCEIDCVVLY